jgi:hypothetical protein
MPTPEKGDKSDFRKWMDTQFDDSVIEGVARLTNTDIQKTPNGLVSSIEGESCAFTDMHSFLYPRSNHIQIR